MPAKRINEIVTSLPFEKKLLAIGSLLMVISVFLPWYEDRDSFNTGDTFLGVTGPLYLAGITIFLLASSNLALLVMDSIGRRVPGGIKSSRFFLAAAAISFYLLIIVNSVYFHNKFGVNITFKQSPFGMFMAFIAWSLMTIGAYLSIRERSSIIKEFQEKAQETLIKIPSQPEVRKPKENLRNMSETPALQPAPVMQTQMAEPEESEQQKNYQPFRSDL